VSYFHNIAAVRRGTPA